MDTRQRLMRLDERVLGGRTGVAVVLGLIALGWATTGIDALLNATWILAVTMGVLTVVTAQAAVRTWRLRTTGQRHLPGTR